MKYPLVETERPSPHQRAAVAADSGSGIGAGLDFSKHSFVNCDLMINLTWGVSSQAKSFRHCVCSWAFGSEA
jgi:hypothetical protein